MGHAAPRGRFVHVYLNGVYWGQYQLTERANAAFMAANFGGQPADYDALNAGRVIDGDDVAWNALLDSLHDGYAAVQHYLDVENYADYVLLQFFGGNNVDWRPESNWMAARRREPNAGFQFFAWDSDVIIRTGANTNIVNFGGPGFLWTLDGGVKQYPEFLSLLAQRAQEHFFDGGMFTPERLRRQIGDLADQIRLAVVMETARWGSGLYTPATWESAVEWIKDTYAPEEGPHRAEIVIEQMREAGLFPLSDTPTFTLNGQVLQGERLAAGDELTMSADQGTIHFTLDGSDPRVRFPVVEQTEFVGQTSPIRVLVPTNNDLGRDWREVGFDDSSWRQGTNGIGFDVNGELTPWVEVNLEAEMKDVNATAYVRVPFQVEDPSRFETMEFSARYDDGFVAYLNGTEIARRNAGGGTWNSRASTAHANVEAIEFESFNLTRMLQLLRPGENVLAVHALNLDPANADFLMTPILRAGVVTDAGVSPTAVPYSQPIEVPANAQIKARTLWRDQWSPLREASVPVEAFPLRISEIMFHPGEPSSAELEAGLDDADEFEFIELVNISDASIDLSGVRFVRSSEGDQMEGVSFEFAASAIQQMAGGGRVLLVEDVEAFAKRYGSELPVAGAWSGGLSNGGEQLTLTVNGQPLLQFRYEDDWYAETDGGGYSLEFVDVANPDLASWSEGANWRSSLRINGSPGTGALDGDVSQDGIVDVFDVDAMLREIRGMTNSPTFDLTDDGNVNQADLDLLVHDFLGTTVGDSDLDGRVDRFDVVRLARYFGSTVDSWAKSDFNGDGLVDFVDLELLRENYVAVRPED
jgi:hypothetical protein